MQKDGPEKNGGRLNDDLPKEGPGKGGRGYSNLRWMGAGIEFCCVIGVFCYIGYKLDEYFSTGPALFLAGFFISFIGMLYLFYKDAK